MGFPSCAPKRGEYGPGRGGLLAIPLLLFCACSQQERSSAASEGPRAEAPDLKSALPVRGALLEDFRALGYADFDGPVRATRNVSIFDPERVTPGWNVFCDQVNGILFVDNHGLQRRRIEVPGRSRVEHVEFVGAGLLSVAVDEGWNLLDGKGKPVWAIDGNAHHDAAENPAGGYFALSWQEHAYRGRRVRFDQVLALPSGGGTPRVLWDSFSAREALRALCPAMPLDQAGAPDSDRSEVVYDYFHINTLDVLAGDRSQRRNARFQAGLLLLCARNANLIFLLDPSMGDIPWSFGPGLLDFPHAPCMTAHGTILVFDNGWHRGWSRVLEIDPRNKRIVWSYEGNPRKSFFSKKRGSAQRLWSGNTLICEADRARAFEVTPGGEIVWSFRNPLAREFGTGVPDSGAPKRDGRRFYRLRRIAP